MKVIIGLGNPGSKYIFTRHNAGFLVTSKLADKYNATFKFESKFNANVAKISIDSEDVYIIQPQTYMNLSGEAVIKFLTFYKIKPTDIIVVYDDISIDLGRIRYRGDGSDGGQKGIKSIIQLLGTNVFPRLKVGIGPQPKLLPSEAFVLQNFTTEEDVILDRVLDLCVESIEFTISNGIVNAQNLYNGKDVR